LRLRLIAPVLLVLAVTAGGFLVTWLDGTRDARRGDSNRAEIAAAEVRNGVDQGANLVESLRRFMLGHVTNGVSNAQFADVGARWLSPVGLPAAAWVQHVTVAGDRELRATLVTGLSPMTAPGIDLSEEPVLAAAIAEPRTLFRVTATPLVRVRDGRTGLFLVQSAARLNNGVLEPGYVVLFVPGAWLFTSATAGTREADTRLQLRIGDTSFGSLGGAAGLGRTFTAAGRRFDVLVPRKRIQGAAALLPWLILGVGLVLATLVATNAATSERRARAQREVERIFKLSPDLITVVGFDGLWRRFNPAFERLFGYTEREALARPYLDFVRPDDRDRSDAAIRRVVRGETTIGFENRMTCKDGSYRWIEWTATPVLDERAVSALGRDVTERHRSESEQIALRRVATLVAEGVEPDDLFAVVAEEIARVIEVPLARVMRYESDDAATQCASFSAEGTEFPFGEQSSLEGSSVLRLVRETSEAARIDDYSGLEGEIAEIARGRGIRSSVGAPIVVAGSLWGAMVVSSYEQLPEDTDARLADFTELLATAIASAESHRALAQLAEEQAALRRVATLVAQGVRPEELFAAVTEEVGQLLPVSSASMGRLDSDGMVTTVSAWSGGTAAFPVGKRWVPEGKNALTMVVETGRSARLDDFADASGPIGVTARNAGYRSAVGTPIVVEGRLWGAMTAASTEEEPLPADIEARLASFTELVATAIANAESGEGLARLADEQAALRRVATLVAQGVPPAEIFSAVSQEVGQLFGSEVAGVLRFEDDGGPPIVFVGVSKNVESVIPVGTRWRLDEGIVSAQVFRTGRSARVDATNWAETEGAVAVAGEQLGVASTVASPIKVEGRLWGAATVSASEPLPPDAEDRLSKFAEIVATAIANADARAAVEQLADEQAALRRVATLVARGVRPAEMFAAVTQEVSHVVDVPAVSVVRYEPDGTATELANFFTGGQLFPAGVRMNIEGTNILRLVRDSSRPARIDDYSQTEGQMAEIVRRAGIRSTVGVPIIVAGRVWGTMVGSTTTSDPLPENTASRLADFTELLATAIENAESGEALQRLAEEQAALRRVATLVAQDVQAAEIFSAVSDEVARLFDTEAAGVARFEHDDQAIVFVGAAKGVSEWLFGTRWSFEDAMATAQVYRTGRSARVDLGDLRPDGGDVVETAIRLGLDCTVASPIVVEGRLWGATSVSATEQLPADAEQRLEKFSELIATAVANAESKSELAASRRRIVAASDETRRRIERDLHDGTQQRLVSLELGLRAAEAEIPPDKAELRAELSRVASGLSEAVEELRELSRGIHPAILSEGGLVPALRTLARRSRVPVEFDADLDHRLPERVEVAAYYIASEALTNAAKHAHASLVRVDLGEQGGCIRLSIRDNGIGGVDRSRGSGLVGLQDRVEALGGMISIDSTPGNGTRLVATLPLQDETAVAAE
jgi:PAS domain S-box-containing protein